jgi:protein-L-isoaspartate O-methyltransferase
MRPAGWMSAAEFEERYRRDGDPWGYETSAYEQDKYAATLAACGEGPFAGALELGSSIGVFSALLAPRCRSLVTVDGSPTAVAAARRRLAGARDVTTVVGRIPPDVPRRDYDLIVASEILYYLTPSELDETLALVDECLVAGGRLVAVHWRPEGPERPLTAAEVHDRLRARPGLEPVGSEGTGEYLLDVLERR